MNIVVSESGELVCPECGELDVYVKVHVGTILAEPETMWDELTFIPNIESLVDCPIVGIECGSCGFVFDGDIECIR